MNEKTVQVERLTPYEAGKMLHSNAETIRAGLRQKVFDFGTAIPPEKPGGKWKYIIIKTEFLKFVGLMEKGEKNDVLCD